MLMPESSSNKVGARQVNGGMPVVNKPKLSPPLSTLVASTTPVPSGEIKVSFRLLTLPWKMPTETVTFPMGAPKWSTGMVMDDSTQPGTTPTASGINLGTCGSTAANVSEEQEPTCNRNGTLKVP